jgi:hypothetical protein
MIADFGRRKTDKPAEREDRFIEFAVGIINLLTSQINNRQSSIEICVNWPNGAC